MATIPNPPVWVDNSTVLNAATLNARIRDVGVFLLNRPMAHVGQSGGGTAVATSTGTNVTNLVATIDNDSMTTVANKLTIKTAGIYLIQASITYPFNATGYRYTRILKNGAYLREARVNPSPTTIGANACLGFIANLAVNDVLELQAYQNSGASLTTVTGIANTFMSAQWIGQP